MINKVYRSIARLHTFAHIVSVLLDRMDKRLTFSRYMLFSDGKIDSNATEPKIFRLHKHLYLPDVGEAIPCTLLTGKVIDLALKDTLAILWRAL